MPTPLSLVDDVAAESDVRPRVLVVARRPVGGLRTHLLLTWTALRDAGFAFTFVGPADESLDRLRAAFGASADADFVGAAIENRRCRLWPVVRDLLHDGCFALLQSHGVTAAAHAALANLPLGVPHLTVLHEPLHAPRSPSWLGRLKHWALEQALRRSDAIVAVSEDVRSSLSEISPVFRSLAERASTIPNGIETRQRISLDDWRAITRKRFARRGLFQIAEAQLLPGGRLQISAVKILRDRSYAKHEIVFLRGFR